MLSPTEYFILYSTIKSHSVFADVTASSESRCHSCISMDTSSIFKDTVPFDSKIYSRDPCWSSWKPWNAHIGDYSLREA
jgi:hypothetical protein